jgi:uncharacterized membrane protein
MAVVITLVILTILGAMSLGTDIAMMFYRRMRLQKAAGVSALAGATYFLTHNTTRTHPSPVTNCACTFLNDTTEYRLQLCAEQFRSAGRREPA